VLTIRQAALKACVCESVVRGWVRDGRLAHYRLGGRGKAGKILIAAEDLDGRLANFKVGARPPPAARPRRRSSTCTSTDAPRATDGLGLFRAPPAGQPGSSARRRCSGLSPRCA